MKKTLFIFIFLVTAFLSKGQTLIPVNPFGVFYNDDTAFQEMVSISRDSVKQYLFNQPTMDPKNNPSLDPTGDGPQVPIDPNLFYPLRYWNFFGGTDTITDVYYFDIYGSDSIYFYTGTPAAPVLYYAGVTNQYNSWVHLTTPAVTKYFETVLKSNGSNISQIVFYGYHSGPHLSRTPSTSQTYVLPTFAQLMGANSDGQPYIPTTIMDSVGNNWRLYQNQSSSDTNTVTHAINSLKFNFDVYSTSTPVTHYYFPLITSPVQTYNWPTNTMVQQYSLISAIGDTLISTFQGFANAIYGNYFPIDPVNHPGAHPDSSLPSNYDRTGRLAYFYASVIGNGGVSFNSQVLNPLAFNYNVARYIEINNELDGNQSPFWTAAAYNAMCSEFVDGNGSASSSLIGVHNADPTIGLVLPATYYMDTSLFDGMRFLSYFTRPDHGFPYVAFDYHYYSFSNPNHTVSYAIPPEQDSVRSKATVLVNHIHLLNPTMDVYNSEWGYDANSASPLGIPHITGVDSATIQAWWVTRYWLALSFSGVRKSNIFQFQNDDNNTPGDNDPNLFGTTGLCTFQEQSSPFGYQIGAKAAYYFTRSLYHLLGNYRADSIISESAVSWWDYRYKNPTSGALCQVVWSPTRTNNVYSSQTVHVGPALQSVNLVTFVNGSTTGNTTTATTDGSGNIVLNIGENPTFIMYTTGATAPVNYIIKQVGSKWILIQN